MDYQMNYCGQRSAKQRYCTSPVVDVDDYEIIRSAARPKFRHKPNNDFVFSLFLMRDGSYTSAKQVIGKRGISFDLILLQAMLLTTFWQMMNKHALVGQQESFASKTKPWKMNVEGDAQDDWRDNKRQRVSHWNFVLSGMNTKNRRNLKSSA